MAGNFRAHSCTLVHTLHETVFSVLRCAPGCTYYQSISQHNLTPSRRRQPDWWRQVAYTGTKLLYQPEPKPVVYSPLVMSRIGLGLKANRADWPWSPILGRLALVSYGAHGTIPYDWHQLQPSHYPRGVCDHRDRPGSGSKLFYINSWAMIWSSDHPRDPPKP